MKISQLSVDLFAEN